MSKFLEKLKKWISEAGLTATAYLALFVVFFSFGNSFLAGAMLGIFVYLNWNVIRKLVFQGTKEK